MHPGNHLGQGAEIGIELIAACLNRVLYEKQQTTLLLETMAGKGTEVGRSFEEIRAILERIALQDKVGVCLDTCHIWDAAMILSLTLMVLSANLTASLACPG